MKLKQLKQALEFQRFKDEDEVTLYVADQGYGGNRHFILDCVEAHKNVVLDEKNHENIVALISNSFIC